MRSEGDYVDCQDKQIGPFIYNITVYRWGRFNINVRRPDQVQGYFIVGDKKSKFSMPELLCQIQNVVLEHAPNNERIKEIVNRYWPVEKWRSKAHRNHLKDLSGFPD